MPAPAPSDRKPPSNAFLRFSGFAFQLLGGVGLAGWLGYRLDRYLGVDFPLSMIVFILVVFAGMLYQAYRKLNED